MDLRQLIIADGGLASLIACASACEEKAGEENMGCALWIPSGEGAVWELRRAAARRHAEMYGLEIIDHHPAETGVTSMPMASWGGEDGVRTSSWVSASQRQTQDLISAAYAAASAGCGTVVWPVQGASGEELNLDEIARIVDRSTLVTRLVGLSGDEHGCPSIRVLTPYADYTDGQLAELAIDMLLPIETCWWWTDEEAQGPSSSRQLAAERERWVSALRDAGWAGTP